MNVTEIARIQKYLREKFDNNRLTLSRRGDATDSAEVLLGEEFLGVVYRDEDEGEISYPFHMSILEMDLPEI